ncbi:MAG: bifunctional phosphopantothenoylcysteine decarboxylase/phosphopantothenate--cysteine ligase CoaBC [Fusobacteriales bacterium]|nr:MAG: bifunctional phosphopantothenoylcysteine decarboxylase/phosphopantothenate--cysteine ligase CoaBC [Fusobacteriales bacterium]
MSLADWADVVLVAPTTYNIIGKIANGIADDMLSTVISATTKPVFFALAMNVNMYNNPILQENIKKLKKYNYKFIDADEGLLACNYVAKGRLKDEKAIVDELERFEICSKFENYSTLLAGKKILISGGRTKEKIDPVRYITNNSSGKMAYSLAQASADLGAEVTLISGPCELEIPTNINKFKKVDSASEMYEEINSEFKNTDIFISCAAVADYTPKEYSTKKIKKADGDLFIELKRTKDILFEMGQQKEKQFLVGFAAETNDIKENALKKLKKKNLDMIVANSALTMSSDMSSVEIIGKNETSIEILNKTKLEIAYEILKQISKKI